ncbi:MAG TPA: apolipoprotein N-acyltransferase, partial [Oscillatoriaceae cyanobacterium]
LAALSGVLLAAAYPGSNQGYLAWFALVPLMLLAFRPRGKRAMAGLFAAFGAGLNLVLLYWFLAMHPLTWLGFTVTQSLGIVIFAWLGASAALTVQFALLGFVYGYVTQRWETPDWRHVLSLALGWTALEWLTSLGPFGFTWDNLALTQVHYLPLIQVLNLVGPFPLAGLIIGVNGALALAIRRQFGKPFALANWQPLGAALFPVACVAAYGLVQVSRPLPDTTFSVEIVQGNIAGSEKFAHGPGALEREADKYFTLTDQHKDAELVIWPETSMPTYVRSMPAQWLYSRLMRTANQENRTLLIGTLDWSGFPPNPQHLYNAVTAFAPRVGNLGFDYKRHLVPFGEYVPGRDLLPAGLMKAAGLMNILGEDFTPGVVPHIFTMPFGNVGTGVCYDGIFPDEMRKPVLAGAQILALVTNDAWYKDTTAPRVLNAHAVLRAVENDRWVLRAANTGISSIIDPHGNIVAETPVFKDETLVGRAAPMDGLTLYTRFGNWAPMLALLGFLAFLVSRWTLRKTAA